MATNVLSERKLQRAAGARAGGRIATGLVVLFLVFSGSVYLIGPAPVVENFHRLGYPDYFREMLGVAKLMGAAAILVGRPSLREWAYAGVTFDLVAAFFSHLLTGDRLIAYLAPLVVLLMTIASYLWWHRQGINASSS